MLENTYTILLIICSFALLILGLSIHDALPFLGFILAVSGGIYALYRTGWLAKLKGLTDHTRRTWRIALGVCVVVYPLVFTWLQSPYWIHVATLAGIYVCLALGLNVTVGFAGLLDLGYIAFYAVGAYASAIFFQHFPEAGWMFWLLLPLAATLAALFGVLLGSPTLRLRGDYLAIVTLGFGQIVRIILNNWDAVTNGPKGISGIPSPVIGHYSLDTGLHLGILTLPRVANFYFLVVLLALAIGIAADRLNHSRIGRAWIAVREDELAARSCGINVMAMKLLAFAIGASFAGMGGVVYSSLIGFVDPMSFTFMESAMILAMVVLGGMGSIPGAVVGAIVLVALPEKLREFQQVRMLIFGAALIAMMIFRPEGLIPSKRREQELLEIEEEELDPTSLEHPTLK